MSGCVAPMCCPRSGPCGASGRVRAPLPLDLQAWPDYANGFDPNAMLGWLGWQPEQLKAAAYQLLGHASSIDPQQRWHPHPPVGLLGPRAAGAQHDEESRRRESHPPPLAEPGVSLSAHRAPIAQPSGRAPNRQCANRPGVRRATSASHAMARRSRRRNRLNFRQAHRARCRLSRRRK
jgi:hypothetical protein